MNMASPNQMPHDFWDRVARETARLLVQPHLAAVDLRSATSNVIYPMSGGMAMQCGDRIPGVGAGK